MSLQRGQGFDKRKRFSIRKLPRIYPQEPGTGNAVQVQAAGIVSLLHPEGDEANRRVGGEETECCRFGEVEVDITREEVRRNRHRVETTPLEFKMLAYFVRNRGRLLSCNQTLDAVWGPGTFITDRVVDNHGLSLRRKIEPDPRSPRYLVSVRGMGYRLEGQNQTES